MEPISSLFTQRIQLQKPKPARHEKAAIVNEIERILGKSTKYNFKYWLRKIGNRSYGEMMAILKETENLPEKYSKGGFLTNRLSNAKPKGNIQEGTKKQNAETSG